MAFCNNFSYLDVSFKWIFNTMLFLSVVKLACSVPGNTCLPSRLHTYTYTWSAWILFATWEKTIPSFPSLRVVTVPLTLQSYICVMFKHLDFLELLSDKCLHTNTWSQSLFNNYSVSMWYTKPMILMPLLIFLVLFWHRGGVDIVEKLKRCNPRSQNCSVASSEHVVKWTSLHQHFSNP